MAGRLVDTDEYFRIKRDGSSHGWQVGFRFHSDLRRDVLMISSSSILIHIMIVLAAKTRKPKFSTRESLFSIIHSFLYNLILVRKRLWTIQKSFLSSKWPLLTKIC